MTCTLSNNNARKVDIYVSSSNMLIRKRIDEKNENNVELH
jgi:hypothetical protein